MVCVMCDDRCAVLMDACHSAPYDMDNALDKNVSVYEM